MSMFPNFVALLLAILLSCPESETANITAIISKAPSPSFAVEAKNLNLEWTYTLDGSVGVATFSIVNDDKSDSAIGSTFGPGTVTFLAGFQARFKAHVTETRAELTFLAVRRSDEGKTFKFSILTTKGGSISETWVLVVNFPANITEISANQTVAEGENVTLKCLAYGKPTANNSWTRLSDDSVVNMPLTDIRRNDTGNYRCTADNGIGQPTIGDVFIDVQYPVETTSFGENATVPPGEKRTFYCPVVGNPKPNISWYRGSEESETPISTGEMLKAGLTGCYMCVASNSLGTSISITQCLTVEESSTASKTPTSPPRGPSPTVIGVVIGIAVFVIIMIGLVTWWMYKKNKCRKHTKNGERHYVGVAN